MATSFELTSTEWAFPLEFEAGTQSVVAFFHISPLTAFEIKQVLREGSLSYKQSDMSRERELELSDDAICREIIGKHFLRISGLGEDATEEQMRAWLEENAYIKGRIFREGVDRVIVDEAVAPAKLVLGSVAENKIRTKRLMVFGDGIEELHFTHHLRRETEMDRIRYRKAIRIAEKGRQQTVSMNFDVIEQIYNDMVTAVDGFTIKGKACDSGNSKDWVHLVPMNDKVLVVARVFSATALKNG